jgi:methionyl-tRNA formyltransferase
MTGVSKDMFPADPRLIFMGTPEFAIPTLNSLVNKGHRVLSVVTQPDRPKGRGRKMMSSPVKRFATEHNIETLQPERVSDVGFCNLIKKKDPDLIIVIAFGQILNKDLLTIPKWGAINIHASLLPKYRGAAPIQRAILNNESRTGLTVMRMDEGLDTGPILYQKEVPIHKDETAGQLHDRLAQIAGDQMIGFLNRMAEEPIEERLQDHSCATYAPKIEKGISSIDWQQDAVKISALVRALDPRPGAYTIIQGKKIKIFSTGVLDEDRFDTIPGRVLRDSDEGLFVETGKGLIKIRGMQYPGKKRLSSSDFLRGFPLPEGTILGE